MGIRSTLVAFSLLGVAAGVTPQALSAYNDAEIGASQYRRLAMMVSIDPGMRASARTAMADHRVTNLEWVRLPLPHRRPTAADQIAASSRAAAADVATERANLARLLG